jgi:DNA polymerase III subunit delta
MIIKSFELNKIDISKKSLFLFYGENEGFKKESISSISIKEIDASTYNYEEKEIIDNLENFYNNLYTESFFEKNKIIIINRCTDKIVSIIENLIEKKVQNIKVILNAGTLDRKSKLRILFEKNEETPCVAFYPDNSQTLLRFANDFFRKNKISISQQAINLIVSRCREDRQNLNNELIKIESFVKNKKNIEVRDLLQLTNLAENYDVSELVDNCLAKNKKKTINIINENNYSSEDAILIIRTFLSKSKRLLKLCEQRNDNQNIESIIAAFKPPIFWKEKEIVKQQIKNWNFNNIKNLIFQINEMEFLLKKNSSNSINILSDFLIEQSSA